MKMNRDHYEELEVAIKKVIEQNSGMMGAYEEQGLSMKRYRWDLLWIAARSGLIQLSECCDKWYKYLNDEHIDTALRKITNTGK